MFKYRWHLTNAIFFLIGNPVLHLKSSLTPSLLCFSMSHFHQVPYRSLSFIPHQMTGIFFSLFYHSWILEYTWREVSTQHTYRMNGWMKGTFECLLWSRHCAKPFLPLNHLILVITRSSGTLTRKLGQRRRLICPISLSL